MKQIKLLAALLLITIAAAAQYTEKLLLPASNGRKVPVLLVAPTKPDPAKKYAVIIFLHGIGERAGTKDSDINLNTLQSNGPQSLYAAVATQHNYKGKGFEFILLAPQLFTGDGMWPTWYAKTAIDYALSKLPVNNNRVYLTGLSYGGGGVLNYLTENNMNSTGIAAALSCCGVNGSTNFCNIANIPVTFYHAKDDGTVGVGNSSGAVSAINNCAGRIVPAMAKYPVSGGHAIWEQLYNKAGDPFLNGVTVYDYFLSNSLDSLPVAMAAPGLDASEVPPKAVAVYKDLNTTAGTVTLDASGSVNVAGAWNYWEVTKKPSGASWEILTAKNGLTVTAKNIIAGDWEFTFNSLKGSTIQASAKVAFSVGAPVPAPGPGPGKTVLVTIKVYTDGTTEVIK